MSPVTSATLALSDEEKEIIDGLQQPQKTISPKFFYDETGSRLFDEICRQPEYYPTRTELRIMEENIEEISDLIGPHASIIEFGSGSSIKTRLLLDNLEQPSAYVPVEISGEHLSQTAERLADDFPDIEVLPICADFTQPFDVPSPQSQACNNVVFFPGSTIGNFTPAEAVDLMTVMRNEAGDEGKLLIGVDLEKPREIIEPAYNDVAGITAEFNLNLLVHLNREYGANFDVAAFEHQAIYDENKKRIEMRLISKKNQSVRIAGTKIELEADEFIVTEHSHKYSPERFADMARQARFAPCCSWRDPGNLFSVQYLEAA